MASKCILTISHNGQQYEVGLPFKDDCLPIPTTTFVQSLLQLPEIYALQVEQDSRHITQISEHNSRVTGNRNH